ncbi:MAG: hypothetical protein FJ272_12495, partial [Planctomycetes bacterium]|nr:hypothetical protein [Planctomycetota bacterium]
MTRVERLKEKLFTLNDRALFLERLEILKRCAAQFEGQAAGVKFGRTLKELLANVSLVIDEDDLIVGRVPEIVPTPEQEKFFQENRPFWWVPWFQTTGHLTISWEMLLQEGLAGIRDRAAKRQEALGGGPNLFGGSPQQVGDSDATSHPSQRDFLEGAMLCCDALATFAARYAAEARRLAAEAAGGRKEDLLR